MDTGKNTNLSIKEQEPSYIELPCKVGSYVRGKTGNWCGTVEEFTYNSEGLFLFIVCGSKYFYVRPDEVLY